MNKSTEQPPNTEKAPGCTVVEVSLQKTTRVKGVGKKKGEKGKKETAQGL